MELQRLHSALKGAFKKVKEEMDDHRDAINETGGEIQTLYGHMAELDEKLEKLKARIDEIHVALEQNGIIKREATPLSEKERELLLLLYTNEQKQLKLQQLARRLSTTVNMLRQYVADIKSKGIPLMEEIRDDQTYLWLDESFRDRQAKLNILGLNEELAATLH